MPELTSMAFRLMRKPISSSTIRIGVLFSGMDSIVCFSLKD
jgi:hypothetical protein